MEHFRAERNYTLLVLGQTGSGKTSFLNLLANFHYVFKPQELTAQDLHMFTEETVSDDALEHALHDQMASKTSNAKIYKIKMGACYLTVVDTPGFGDSRGISEDQAHVKRIMDALADLGGLNCVLLTINGRDARLTATLQYVLAQLTGIMPKEVLDNLAVVFTNTEKPRKLNFQISKLTEIGLKKPPFVCLENPLCEVQKLIKSECPPDKEDLKDIKGLVSNTACTIIELLTHIQDFKPLPTLRFIELNNKREQIEALLSNILEKHSEEQARIADLEKFKTQIMMTGEVKPISREHESFKLVPAQFNWSHYVCHQNGCHCNCVQSGVVAPFAQIWCFFHKDDVCSSCNHQYKSHVVSTSGWVRTVEHEIVNLGDIESAKTAKERMQIAVGNLEKEQARAVDEKMALTFGLRNALEEYSKLGLRDAYQRMLNAQKLLLTERLAANPEDVTLQDMLNTIGKVLEEVERMAEIECCICMEALADTQLNCGHKQFCKDCGQRLGFCPLCRSRVTWKGPVKRLSSASQSAASSSSSTTSPDESSFSSRPSS